MIDRVRRFLNAHITLDHFKNDDELYINLVLFVVTLFALTMHVFLLAYYAVLRVPVMIAGNSFSLAVYTGCFQLLRRKRYSLIGTVIAVEVTFYVFLSLHFIGYDSTIILYWFLIMVMQVCIPYAAAGTRTVTLICVWLCTMGAMTFANQTTPVYEIPLSAKTVMAYFNVNAAFWGIIMVLFLGNFIRKAVRAINDGKMEALQSQAHTDALTGLYNRQYSDLFFAELRCAPSRHWCVAMLDIDDFKLINDEYGHPIGDKVLVHLSSYIRKCLRKTDILFRWGGEEFLLFLEGVSLDTAVSILDKLREGIASQRISLDETDFSYTVTIGVVVLDVHDIAGGIHQCDKNMYNGKISGKNMVVGG